MMKKTQVLLVVASATSFALGTATYSTAVALRTMVANAWKLEIGTSSLLAKVEAMDGEYADAHGEILHCRALIDRSLRACPPAAAKAGRKCAADLSLLRNELDELSDEVDLGIREGKPAR
jgi:hypothetical protein